MTETAISFLLDIIKLSAAGLLVFYIIYANIKPLIAGRNARVLLDLKKASVEATLPLRLQAYERIVLFVERINPSALLLRYPAGGMSVAALHNILLTEVRAEFEHNITQQIYVSATAWQVVKKVKEETIGLINNVAKNVSPEAPALELSKIILSHLASLEDDPYEAALAVIKSEIQQLF